MFDKNTKVTTFEECFEGCTSIKSIPSGLFDKNTLVRNFTSVFEHCTSLTTVPQKLFDKNRAVEYISYAFIDCDSLSTFTIYIGSSKIRDGDANRFAYSSISSTLDKTKRIVYVPANSTTYTSFQNAEIDARYGGAYKSNITLKTYTPA